MAGAASVIVSIVSGAPNWRQTAALMSVILLSLQHSANQTCDGACRHASLFAASSIAHQAHTCVGTPSKVRRHMIGGSGAKPLCRDGSAVLACLEGKA